MALQRRGDVVVEEQLEPLGPELRKRLSSMMQSARGERDLEGRLRRRGGAAEPAARPASTSAATCSTTAPTTPSAPLEELEQAQVELETLPRRRAQPALGARLAGSPPWRI